MPESPTRVLSKARAVLDCFLPDNRPMSLTEVAAATGLPLTTAQRLLRSLVAEEFVSREGTRYKLGLGLIGWASAAQRGLNVIDAARRGMENLRDETDETVTLHMREGLQRICVASAASRQVISARSEPGQVTVLQAGAPSKILMAWDDEVIHQVLEHGLVRLTPSTVTDPDRFLSELEVVRERGYARSSEENAAGVASVCVPVRDSTGKVIAALCIGGPISRTTPKWLEQHRKQIEQVARTVSIAMGWRADVEPA